MKAFLFEVFQSHHNYLSFGSKLLLRASVFSLLQLHWIFVAAIFGFLSIFPPGGWWSTRDFSCRGSSSSKASQQKVSPRLAWKCISWDQRLKWKYISKLKDVAKKQRLSRQLCHKKMQNSNKQTVPPEGQVREMRWQLVQNDLVESVTKYYIKLFQKYYLVKPQKYMKCCLVC